jgi:hypothetical protein
MLPPILPRPMSPMSMRVPSEDRVAGDRVASCVLLTPLNHHPDRRRDGQVVVRAGPR